MPKVQEQLYSPLSELLPFLHMEFTLGKTLLAISFQYYVKFEMNSNAIFLEIFYNDSIPLLLTNKFKDCISSQLHFPLPRDPDKAHTVTLILFLTGDISEKDCG